MLHKGKLAEAKPPTQQNKLRWNVLLEDLRFLASVGLAHFIVWRTLRRRYGRTRHVVESSRLLRGEGVRWPNLEPQVLRGLIGERMPSQIGNRNFRPER